MSSAANNMLLSTGESIRNNELVKRLLVAGVSLRSAVAECIGMAIFVCVATGAATGLTLPPDVSGLAAVTVDARPATILYIATAFGLTITALAFAAGHTSGGQFNPAVTIGLMAAAHISVIQALVNVAAQVVGAILGSAIVAGMTPGGGLNDTLTLGANILPNGITAGRAFLGEMFGTFVLVLVVLETACNKDSIAGTSAPIPIGFTVFVIHLLLIPFTTCGINPARTIGPAIISGEYSRAFAVFMFAPVCGALVASLVHRFFTWKWDTINAEKAELANNMDYKGDVVRISEALLKEMAAKMGIVHDANAKVPHDNDLYDSPDAVKADPNVKDGAAMV